VIVRYRPHTREDASERLDPVGVDFPGGLFPTIPESRRRLPRDLPGPMTGGEFSINDAEVRRLDKTSAAPGTCQSG
jgi:hypothetical protein